MKEQLALDLYLAFEFMADHFTAMLFRLIHKADSENRIKIQSAYPLEVIIYDEWYNSSNADAFYDKYKVKERVMPGRC